MQENAILKPIKNEYEKYKKSKETKQEKIQYLIETNNFNFFYNNQNSKSNKIKSISKFENLKINSSISLSYNQIPINSKAKEETKNLEENEKYKNNYDKDEEINESEFNLNDEDYEENNNINYDEINEDMNQEGYNENDVYYNYENEGDKNIKKKKRRRRRKKNKSQISDDIIINKEQNTRNVITETKNVNNDTNKSHDHLSSSQKKKNKFKRKLDNMKSNNLALLGEKELLFKENEQLKEKIKELESLLNKNILDNNINKTNTPNPEKENKIKIDNEDAVIQLNEKILEKDIIIDELSETLSKIEKEYKLSLKQITSMQSQISNLEKNIGIDEQMNNLKSLISKKEEEIIILSDQIKEYQNKCDDIIIGNSQEAKEEQIKLLLNEVNSIRTKIQNILTFEGRINNYEEFMDMISKVIKYLEENENEEMKIICEKLKFLWENYELYGQKFYNRIMQEIFGINYEDYQEEGNNGNDNIIGITNDNNYNECDIENNQ